MAGKKKRAKRSGGDEDVVKNSDKDKTDGVSWNSGEEDNGLEELEEEDERERVSPREAGLGLIILGSMLLLIAVIMPFVLGSSADYIWGLGPQAFLFGIAGLVAIGIGALLYNYRRLSRKL